MTASVANLIAADQWSRGVCVSWRQVARVRDEGRENLCQPRMLFALGTARIIRNGDRAQSADEAQNGAFLYLQVHPAMQDRLGIHRVVANADAKERPTSLKGATQRRF